MKASHDGFAKALNTGHFWKNSPEMGSAYLLASNIDTEVHLGLIGLFGKHNLIKLRDWTKIQLKVDWFAVITERKTNQYLKLKIFKLSSETSWDFNYLF